MNKGSKLLIHV